VSQLNPKGSVLVIVHGCFSSSFLAGASFQVPVLPFGNKVMPHNIPTVTFIVNFGNAIRVLW
jgi:hypothetical protein